MDKGNVIVYYGEGKGKSTSALGHAIRAASRGKSVILIQFLKGKNDEEFSFIRRLEPEIKFFRFEKSLETYDALSEAEKHEAAMNIRNGLNYARKVLATGECNILILDEFLGLMDEQVIRREDVLELLRAKSPETELIFTGRVMDESMRDYADEIYQIRTEKA